MTCKATNARQASADCGTMLVSGGVGWANHSPIAGLIVPGTGIVRAGTGRPAVRSTGATVGAVGAGAGAAAGLF